MPINLMAGALSALILQSRRVPRNKVIAGAAISAFTPGILGLALPLAIAAQTPRPEPEPPDGGDGDGDEVTDLYVLPDVTGEDKAHARTRLKAVKMQVAFQLAEVRCGSAENPPRQGTVLSQEPPGGRSVPAGTKVLLYVQPDEVTATA